MAEDRRRGFLKRLFGTEDAPAGAPEGNRPGDEPTADAVAFSPEATLVASHAERMADGLVVPDLARPEPADMAAPGPDAPPQDYEQLRTDAVVTPPPPSPAVAAPAETLAASAPRQSWIERLRSGLSRSSQSLTAGIAGVLSKRKLDDFALADIESLLLQADLGVETSVRVADAIGRERLDRNISPEELRALLAGQIEAVLAPVAKPLAIASAKRPFVVLLVGVNGTGKTTTIGKLASRYRSEGRTVMLAAGDTFRAAAIEQLKVWGERARAPVVSRAPGSDAAGLAYDAMVEAKKAGTDILLVDTAGRLQNRSELMAELAKIIRVVRKLDPSAPHAVLLTLDATTGQNALSQVEVFREQAGVTGLVMTKLDGTARGGILVAIAAKEKLPVHFIGVGEAIEDLAPFSAGDFARALVGLA